MKKIILLFFAACCMLYANYCFALDKIVAVVNDDIITQKDLNDFINFTRIQLRQQLSGKELESKIQSMKLDLIDRLVEDKLILQEAKRLGVTVDENRVQARINEIKRNYRDDLEFQNSLKSQGLVLADITTRIREQFMMFNLIEYQIRNSITVNPIEVTGYYQNNLAEFKIGEQREFESISVNDKTMADSIYESLKKGQSFSDTAKVYTLPINKLTVTETGQLKKDIEDIIFKLAQGEYSEVVEIDNNYYVFRLANIIPAREQVLVEVRDKIYTYLFNKKMEEEMIKWLAQLRKQSYIKISQDQN